MAKAIREHPELVEGKVEGIENIVKVKTKVDNNG